MTAVKKKKGQRGDPLYKRKIAIIDSFVDVYYDKGKELRHLKTLSGRYSLDFLETVKIHFKIKSLIWFLGNGKKTIDQFYKISLLDKEMPKEEESFLKEKIGEDKKIIKKQTLENFLNEKKET